MKYLLETRLTRKADWEPLCEGTFTKAEVELFFADLERGDDRLFRARMLPQFGYDTREFSWVPKGGWRDEGPLVLARNMPDSVHAMNDEILTALGV